MNKLLRSGTLLFPVLFLLITLSVFSLSGCNERPGDGLPPINEDSVKPHAIPLSLAIELTKSFRGTVDSLNVKCPQFKDSMRIGRSEAFNSDVFKILMKQKDSSGNLAAGIRIYFGRGPEGQIKLVMVPYGPDGKDILNHLISTDEKQVPGVSPAKTRELTTGNGAQAMETGQLCPPSCPPPGPLDGQ